MKHESFSSRGKLLSVGGCRKSRVGLRGILFPWGCCHSFWLSGEQTTSETESPHAALVQTVRGELLLRPGFLKLISYTCARVFNGRERQRSVAGTSVHGFPI